MCIHQPVCLPPDLFSHSSIVTGQKACLQCCQQIETVFHWNETIMWTSCTRFWSYAAVFRHEIVISLMSLIIIGAVDVWRWLHASSDWRVPLLRPSQHSSKEETLLQSKATCLCLSLWLPSRVNILFWQFSNSPLHNGKLLLRRNFAATSNYG